MPGFIVTSPGMELLGCEPLMGSCEAAVLKTGAGAGPSPLEFFDRPLRDLEGGA